MSELSGEVPDSGDWSLAYSKGEQPRRIFYGGVRWGDHSDIQPDASRGDPMLTWGRPLYLALEGEDDTRQEPFGAITPVFIHPLGLYSLIAHNLATNRSLALPPVAAEQPAGLELRFYEDDNLWAHDLGAVHREPGYYLLPGTLAAAKWDGAKRLVIVTAINDVPLYINAPAQGYDIGEEAASHFPNRPAFVVTP